jgi:hypothetical protein
LISAIQDKISKAYSNAQEAGPIRYNTMFETAVSDDKMLQVEQNFESLFSTIVWFLEQDPYTNVAMNLEVNYCKVKQESHFVPTPTGKEFLTAIMEKGRTTFQNSQIHLLFYEKIKAQKQSSNVKVQSWHSLPQVSSMSMCHLKKNFQCNVDKMAHQMELHLVERDATAQFVTQKQYEHLMFVLGQRPRDDSRPSCRDLLTLLNCFPTDCPENFKNMLYQLQLPFEYDVSKPLATNRQYFKDFFSCLTNIRCAVVEGGHHCEAACRTLQGIELGDHLQFEHKDIVLPQSSTLFKPVLTQVYFCQDEEQELDEKVLFHLQKISKSIADQKQFIVHLNWHNFFDQVQKDINLHPMLLQTMYKTPEDFFTEDVAYIDMSKPKVRSNMIKNYLHQILTNAIFTYTPCKELLNIFDTQEEKPKKEKWAEGSNMFLSLSADPFHQVS